MVNEQDRNGSNFKFFREQVLPIMEKMGYKNCTHNPYFIRDQYNQLLNNSSLVCNWSIGYWSPGEEDINGLIVVSYTEHMLEGFCDTRPERFYKIIPVGNGVDSLKKFSIPLNNENWGVVHDPYDDKCFSKDEYHRVAMRHCSDVSCNLGSLLNASKLI